MRNSNIILSKGIKLDKSYNNCLTLSSEELLEVLRSESHYITSASDFSFIRSNGSSEIGLSVRFGSSICLLLYLLIGVSLGPKAFQTKSAPSCEIEVISSFK